MARVGNLVWETAVSATALENRVGAPVAVGEKFRAMGKGQRGPRDGPALSQLRADGAASARRGGRAVSWLQTPQRTRWTRPKSKVWSLVKDGVTIQVNEQISFFSACI